MKRDGKLELVLPAIQCCTALRLQMEDNGLTWLNPIFSFSKNIIIIICNIQSPIPFSVILNQKRKREGVPLLQSVNFMVLCNAVIWSVYHHQTHLCLSVSEVYFLLHSFHMVFLLVIHTCTQEGNLQSVHIYLFLNFISSPSLSSLPSADQTRVVESEESESLPIFSD